MEEKKEFPIQVSMDDVHEMLKERDMQILQLRSVLRQLSGQVTALEVENAQMRKDLEERGKLKSIKKKNGETK